MATTERLELGGDFIATHEAHLLAEQIQHLVKVLGETDGSTDRSKQYRHGTAVTLLLGLTAELVKVTGQVVEAFADLPAEIEIETPPLLRSVGKEGA